MLNRQKEKKPRCISKHHGYKSINNKKQLSSKNWFVYIILCSDDSLYTGITTDVDKRFLQHKNKKGAKYFYGRSPIKIVFTEPEHDRSSASKRENEIKKFCRTDKLLLIKKKAY